MGPAYRTFAGMMICLFFAVALMILAGLAYVFNSWFSLALVTSVPFVVLFRFVYFIHIPRLYKSLTVYNSLVNKYYITTCNTYTYLKWA